MFHREKQPFIKLISIALQFEDRLHRWDSLHKMLVIHDLNALYANIILALPCNELRNVNVEITEIREASRSDLL